ncbi:hypothetical protein BJY01DRAFT_229227 [Aspergillus pseudoustus]|uniref:Secreted protein n=1 Tax=Aspergillus pseudoustus TaxID=1810923 RepID=A0ABR4IHP9_9EURO
MACTPLAVTRALWLWSSAFNRDLPCFEAASTSSPVMRMQSQNIKSCSRASSARHVYSPLAAATQKSSPRSISFGRMSKSMATVSHTQMVDAIASITFVVIWTWPPHFSSITCSAVVEWLAAISTALWVTSTAPP